MTRVLNGNVWVDDKFYAAGSAPTGPVAIRIGDHLWTDVQTGPVAAIASPPVSPDDNQPRVDIEQPSQFMSIPTVLDPTTPELQAETATAPPPPTVSAHVPKPPPRSGKGGMESAWREYAAAIGVEVSQADGRNDIIAAVRRAGLPV